MPFENINFGLLRPQTQLENPGEIMAKVLQLKNMQGQGQLQGMQIQQAQQGLQDAATFRDKYGVSPGVAQAAQKMQLGNLENVKAQHEAAKAELEAAKSFRDQQWQTYSQATPENWPQVKAQAMANAQAFAEKTGRPLPPGAGASDEEVFDPAKQKQRLDSLLTFDQKLKQAEINLKESAAKSELGKFAADMGTTIDDPKAQAAWLKMHPKSTMSLSVTPGSGTPSADPAKRSSRALQIANGEIPIVKPTRGDTRAEQDMADARQIMVDRGEDPIMLPGKYDSVKKGQVSFTAGQPNAKIITAMNTASNHVEKVLRPAAVALNNGDWQSANKLANALGVEFGKDEKTNFDSIATFLATEVAKVASGGGQPTMTEIAEARRMFPSSGSNKQIMGAIDIANKIMGGKLEALDLEHKNAFGGKSILDSKRLSPEAVKNLSTASGDATPSNGGKPAGASQPEKATLGKNPRFPHAMWTGNGPDGRGWYENLGGGMIRKVE